MVSVCVNTVFAGKSLTSVRKSSERGTDHKKKENDCFNH